MTLELLDPNTFSVAKREGFEPVEEDKQEDPELEALREQAKELGIKNAHNMKKEKLLEKIAEAEQK